MCAVDLTRTPTEYDEVEYPSYPFDYTHPRSIATIAAVYGMLPPSVRSCRVLELGCGAGSNIVPMAYQYPGSYFVGIDLSHKAIARGNALVDALGLENVSLQQCDILDVDSSFGTFDYIIAHGVYSWVPEQVRKKIFAIGKGHLNPNGVIYVSYNANPYSYMRDMVRAILKFHTRHVTDPKSKVKQARAITEFITEASQETSLHGTIMREQRSRIRSLSDEVLLHDDLNETASAFHLHEVADAASQEGLKYLGDVDFPKSDIERYPEPIRDQLLQFPESAFVDRQQYQDFIDGNGFRRSLFCRSDVQLKRGLSADFIDPFFVSASVQVLSQSANFKDDSTVEFLVEGDDGFSVTDPLAKCALYCLGQAWPSSLCVLDLLQECVKLLDRVDRFKTTEDILVALRSFLIASVYEGRVEFKVDAPDLVRNVGSQPIVSALARLQAKSSLKVTNLVHRLSSLPDKRACEFLQFVDGTRTMAELETELEMLDQRTSADQLPGRPNAKALLEQFAKLGLLMDTAASR